MEVAVSEPRLLSWLLNETSSAKFRKRRGLQITRQNKSVGQARQYDLVGQANLRMEKRHPEIYHKIYLLNNTELQL